MATASAQPAAPIGPEPPPKVHAAPVAPTSTCQVGVSRAPDDVRAAIAQWVNAEPRCATSLEVRVVATEGGYYVLAYSGNGRVFERVVPDAQAVGVLVASWAADDHPAPSAAPVAPPAVAPASEPAPATAPGLAPRATFQPPSSVAPTPIAMARSDDRDRGPIAASTKPEQRWLALGAMTQLEIGGNPDTETDSSSIRVDLDLVRFGRVSIGAGFGLAQSNLVMYGYSTPYGYIDTDDVRLTGSINYTRRSGKWAFRATGSVGMLYTSGNGQFDTMAVSAEGAFPMIEAAAVVARDLTATWGIVVGPVASAYQQDYVFVSNGSYYTMSRSPEISLYAAVLKRL